MPSEPVHTETDLEDFVATPLQMTVLTKKRLREFADLADKFIAGSIVTDVFKDHSHRRMWRTEMNDKYGHEFMDITEQNILRGNNLAGIYSWLHMISESLDMFKIRGKRADALRELGKQTPDISQYDSHTPEEKLKIAQEYVRICEEYLKVVGR